jgi:hypothetical protein
MLSYQGALYGLVCVSPEHSTLRHGLSPPLLADMSCFSVDSIASIYVALRV